MKPRKSFDKMTITEIESELKQAYESLLKVPDLSSNVFENVRSATGNLSQLRSSFDHLRKVMEKRKL
jgi:predicted ATP-dependent serine protease